MRIVLLHFQLNGQYFAGLHLGVLHQILGIVLIIVKLATKCENLPNLRRASEFWSG